MICQLIVHLLVIVQNNKIKKQNKNIYSSLFICQKRENVSFVKLILLYFDILHSVHYNSFSTLLLWNPEQQVAPITVFGAQLCLQLMYYIEEFSAVVLLAENIKQLFFTIGCSLTMDHWGLKHVAAGML